MQKYLLIIMVLIMPFTAAAQAQISNLVMPVSYFVNHVKQLSLVEDNLAKYRKASIIGISGMGKTQLARMYAYENKNDYQIIWFCDCNLDLNEEFVKLAKAINMEIKSNVVSENALQAKKDIMFYLASKDKWLLVFDNLKVKENNKIQEFINWEHNGHIIFGAQDGESLPNIVKMAAFEKKDAVTLAANILKNNDPQLVEFLTQEFAGYPILIVHGAQLLKQVPGLDKEEYRKKIQQSPDKIKLNITLAIKELKPSAKELLNKIALINNQGFSKDLLRIITNDPNLLDDDIYQLSKFALISNIDTNEVNPIFEMHDIIAQKVTEINGNIKNKNYLEEMVPKFTNSMPKSVIKSHIFRTSKTFHETLMVILRNAERYNIDILQVMGLNKLLQANYLNSGDYYNVNQTIEWFNKKKEQGKLKLWAMNNNEKALYALYLGGIGSYYRNAVSKHNKAIKYFLEAKEILESIKNNENWQYSITYHLAMTQIALGQLELAEQNIQLIEQMLSSNVVKNEMGLLHHAKARLLYSLGNYSKAALEVDKGIEVFVENGISVNDLILTPILIFKAEILNSLNQYQDAYIQAEQVYNVHKPVKKEDHAVFGQIFTQMSRATLGLGDAKRALEYAEKAKTIFIMETNRGNDDLATSTDIYLAKALVAQGNALAALGQNDKSISSYTAAENLYWNNYQNNMSNVDEISSMYLDAARSVCNLPEKAWYAKFHDEHITRFGSEHPRSIELLNMDLKCYH